MPELRLLRGGLAPGNVQQSKDGNPWNQQVKNDDSWNGQIEGDGKTQGGQRKPSNSQTPQNNENDRWNPDVVQSIEDDCVRGKGIKGGKCSPSKKVKDQQETVVIDQGTVQDVKRSADPQPFVKDCKAPVSVKIELHDKFRGKNLKRNFQTKYFFLSTFSFTRYHP